MYHNLKGKAHWLRSGMDTTTYHYISVLMPITAYGQALAPCAAQQAKTVLTTATLC